MILQAAWAYMKEPFLFTAVSHPYTKSRRNLKNPNGQVLNSLQELSFLDPILSRLPLSTWLMFLGLEKWFLYGHCAVSRTPVVLLTAVVTALWNFSFSHWLQRQTKARRLMFEASWEEFKFSRVCFFLFW